jgi:hypothetical protein
MNRWEIIVEDAGVIMREGTVRKVGGREILRILRYQLGMRIIVVVGGVILFNV